MRTTKRYAIVDEIVEQPARHGRPGGGSLPQRVKILIPRGAAADSAVLFILGNESVLSDRDLLRSYLGYGERTDMIVLGAEHRGYGASIAGEDQGVPAYVTVDEALADYHEVFLRYRERYRGPWIVGGYSYGGGLSIAYGRAYPDDAAAILSSSGVVDWEPEIPSYDAAARENLGEALYERLCRHVDRLTPARPFDDNWRSREILYAFVTGLSQMGDMNARLLGPFGRLAKLPTAAFARALRSVDALLAGGEARRYADSNSRTSLTGEEARTGRYAWRVWRYQQATQTGTFWAPAGPDSIYRRKAEDWREECRLLFGAEPPIFRGATWKVRDMVPGLEAPLVYVRGGRDPWRGAGLAPDYRLAKGAILNFEDSFHCPDRGAKDGLEVIEALLDFAEGRRRG